MIGSNQHQPGFPVEGVWANGHTGSPAPLCTAILRMESEPKGIPCRGAAGWVAIKSLMKNAYGKPRLALTNRIDVVDAGETLEIIIGGINRVAVLQG